ncbi:suppressor of cytokine signaling 1b [Sebastes umbrosus]|uniref:suppressor of cytokine signaling 1b n=1 Tax=Sebastes umbrosus TaxID=72105 RepID=UPI00189FD8F6|nr:suppressor of cytokine signaling 1b [Sebastes umbrosus]XP_037620095.1 suppressor of cytokine signaling 1b [Sebastes umbrosus]XP_037620096.1 suppressor of cytokine signaling 1b [Sebastes umbrosus]
MVRDNLDRVVPSRKQNRAAETQNQSQPPEEPAGPERAQSPEKVQPESQEPTERQLDLLNWKKLNLQEEPEAWCQLPYGADAESLPTHLRPFSSAAEYKLVKHTYKQLQHSGYYWGSMTMEEAHEILARAPLGTFLIRDSGQPDVFFTLSYQSEDGPTSVRVQLNNLLFSLYGSHKTFASFFALLTYYTSSSCKLTAPYRKQRPERLKQMCRRALMGSYGAESISTLPGLSTQVKDYVHAYPCCI